MLNTWLSKCLYNASWIYSYKFLICSLIVDLGSHDRIVLYYSIASPTSFILVTADDPLLWVQHLDRPGVSYCCRTTYDDNAITNAVEIYDSPRLPS